LPDFDSYEGQTRYDWFSEMNQTADLDAALGFVVGRIEAEAKRSDEPLSDEQSQLLHHLPKQAASPPNYALDPEFPMTVMQPRDAAYERLVALAKGARKIDLQLDSSSELDWEYAAAVSKLNRHPMSWLLDWAGVQVRRPWWDGWLLLAFSLILVSSVLGLSLVAAIESWKLFAWATIGAVCLVIATLLFCASRWTEKWQLKQRIESCRRESLFRKSF
jgi:hypothetical protein